MTNATSTPEVRSNGPQRFIVLVLGACLALMLAVSFLYRLEHPGLKIQRMPRSAMNGQGTSNDQMGQIGKLMRQLGEKPNDPDLLLQLAEFFMSRQDWDNAETFLARALVARPADLRTLHHFGLAQFQQKHYAAAAETFEQIILIEPHSSTALFNLGTIYGRFLDKPERALDLLQSVIASPDATPELKKNAKAELAFLVDRKAHGKNAETK